MGSTKKKLKPWTTISIPNGLDDELEKFLKTRDAYRLGLTSKSQAIAHFIRIGISYK